MKVSGGKAAVGWIASEDYGRNWGGTEGSELSTQKSSFNKEQKPRDLQMKVIRKSRRSVHVWPLKDMSFRRKMV